MQSIHEKINVLEERARTVDLEIAGSRQSQATIAKDGLRLIEVLNRVQKASDRTAMRLTHLTSQEMAMQVGLSKLSEA